MNLIHESISISFRDQPVDRQYVEFQEHDVTLKYPCRADTNTCSPFKVKFKPGLYFIELWGASGGYSDSHPELGGYGSYTSGFLPLPSRTTFYFYLGQQGKYNGFPTFNGGGKGSLSLYESSDNSFSGSGGGASDMRYTFGEWNDFNSLKSRIIVSAGGAGSTIYFQYIKGGHGGGINGYAGSKYIYQETQYKLTSSTGASNILGGISCIKDSANSSEIINGTFGIGASPMRREYGSGGGGGYYGGGGGFASGGSGGSAFVHEMAIYQELISGSEVMPSPYGETEIGHLGNGFVKISFISSYYIKSCMPTLNFNFMISFGIYMILK